MGENIFFLLGVWTSPNLQVEELNPVNFDFLDKLTTNCLSNIFFKNRVVSFLFLALPMPIWINNLGKSKSLWINYLINRRSSHPCNTFSWVLPVTWGDMNTLFQTGNLISNHLKPEASWRNMDGYPFLCFSMCGHGHTILYVSPSAYKYIPSYRCLWCRSPKLQAPNLPDTSLQQAASWAELMELSFWCICHSKSLQRSMILWRLCTCNLDSGDLPPHWTSARRHFRPSPLPFNTKKKKGQYEQQISGRSSSTWIQQLETSKLVRFFAVKLQLL